MTHYNEYFNSTALFISGIYCCFFIMLFWRILNGRNYTLNDRIVFVSSFVFFVLFTFLNSYFDIFPYFPDTIRFAQLVENNVILSPSLGVKLYWFISMPIRLLSFNQIEVYLVWQSAIYFFSVLLLWKGWSIHCSFQKIQAGSFQVLTLLALFYPAALTFITIPLREFVQIFGFSLFLYGLSNYVYKNKSGWLLLGALITVFVRPQLVIVYPFMVIIAKQKNLLKLVVYAAIALPIAVILFESITGYQFTPSFFSYLRNAAGKTYGASGMTYGLVQWHTYSDILLDLPLLTLQFILSPLPIMHHVNPFSLKLMLIDMFYVVFILFGAVSVQRKYSDYYLKSFLFLSIIFSIWEFYIGGAVRHRLPLIMMLLPLAGLYYTQLLSKLLKANTNDK